MSGIQDSINSIQNFTMETIPCAIKELVSTDLIGDSLVRNNVELNSVSIVGIIISKTPSEESTKFTVSDGCGSSIVVNTPHVAQNIDQFGLNQYAKFIGKVKTIDETKCLDSTEILPMTLNEVTQHNQSVINELKIENKFQDCLEMNIKDNEKKIKAFNDRIITKEGEINNLEAIINGKQKLFENEENVVKNHLIMKESIRKDITELENRKTKFVEEKVQLDQDIKLIENENEMNEILIDRFKDEIEEITEKLKIQIEAKLLKNFAGKQIKYQDLEDKLLSLQNDNSRLTNALKNSMEKGKELELQLQGKNNKIEEREHTIECLKSTVNSEKNRQMRLGRGLPLKPGQRHHRK